MVFFTVCLILDLKVGAVSFDGAETFVDVHVMVMQVDDTDGNIGAMVADTLQTGEQIRPDKARLDAAAALLQAQDVAGTHLFLQIVNDLLQRFYLV